MTNIPDELRSSLSPGEQALWWGRPRQGLVLRGSDALAIPFSLLWCGFVTFWEASVLRSNAPAFFVLWGMPFVGIGLYMVVGRFFVEARQRANTFYAVTGERVLIVSGMFSRKTSTISLKTLNEVALSEGRAGEGSISFGPQNPFGALFGGASSWPGASQKAGPRFDLIPNAKAVFEIIRGAQRG